MVPTHEVAHWVQECIGSICRQSPSDLEIIVIDDHSTDGTGEIVRDLATRDPRIRLVHATEYGGATARNTGVALARGKYLVFADGDDIVPDGAYAALVAALEGSGSDMAVGNFLKFSPTNTWQPGKNWRIFESRHEGVTLSSVPVLLRGRACWNKMFTRDFWVETGIRFPEVARSNDIVPMMTAYLAARAIEIVPETVYLYRERPGGKSMTARADVIGGLVSYLEQEVECLRLIEATGDARLINEFFSLFLRADGWVHLDKFLQREGVAEVSRADLARVGQAVATILEFAPERQWNGLKSDRRRVFRLFGAGRADLIRLLDGAASIGAEDAEATVVSFRASAGLARELFEVLDGDRELALRVVRHNFLAPLLSTADMMPAEELAPLMALVAHTVAEMGGAGALKLRPNERAAVKMCAASDAGELRKLSAIMKAFRGSVTSVTFQGGRFRIRGDLSGLTATQTLGLLAKRRGSGVEREIPISRIRRLSGLDGTFEVSVPALVFAKRATWDLHFLVHDGSVSVEASVPMDHATDQIPAGRGWPVVAIPVKRAGYLLVIVSRGNLVHRWMRRARQALPPGRVSVRA